ncbi:hypothetical protein [Vibrio tarriae]|uniref:hypothetical protein n=1 Tax=Vibrio tarriae TaxID=2014742 RepID=UPI000DE4EC1A|nr:hypothetical protein [Vibrio tarriae]RBM50276.1 hypothetical protein DLR64_12385 [Vibrio tarriae]
MIEHPFPVVYCGDVSSMNKEHAERFIIESSIILRQVELGIITGVSINEMKKFHNKVVEHLLQLNSK